MQVVAICETFGWTYNDYLDAPTWLIALIREKMAIDAQKAEQAAKKAERHK